MGSVFRWRPTHPQATGPVNKTNTQDIWDGRISEKKKTHKDIFPSTIITHKVEPVLPQVVVRRTLRLYIDKVGVARARVARDANAQREETMIRHVIRELAK
jgi:hypothetical protein